MALNNRIIDRLPAEDRAALLAWLAPFDFAIGHVFCEPGDAVTHIHFVYSGIISAVAVMEDGRTVETFMVGREGATNVAATEAPVRGHSRLVAQVAGQSRRIEVGKLRNLIETRPSIRAVLTEYSAGLQSELEQSIACNALHRAEQRFAKWLLRCHDRTDGDVMSLTQEYLASMLGSQRTTVNEAAQTLQRTGAITYSRGRISVRDRASLEQAACECYGTLVGLQTLADPDEAA